ncbi:MAG: hypothetical protein JSU85_10735 [Candidatus Zixiibacteriota bacterium]|nr:MAG: hypothetical protein JSU85_10735 [candidate division Zixibacteria bacterium]
MNDLKYEKEIKEILSLMYDSKTFRDNLERKNADIFIFDGFDKEEIVDILFEIHGRNMNRSMEIQLEKGYSVERQVEKTKNAIRKLDSTKKGLEKKLKAFLSS